MFPVPCVGKESSSGQPAKEITITLINEKTMSQSQG